VGSDGSPEDVESVVDGLKDDRIHVVRFPQRRGKPSVLNDLVPRCQGEIVILTDARQPFALGALAALLENFADSSIGVVSGELVFRTDVEDSSAARGIDAYWRYEKMIRKAESRFRSVPGATGACYAIRRELFMPIPAATLLDDVAIPMQAMARGVRCVFEERAVVYDAPAQSSAQEAVRKRRTIAGNAQLALLRPRWLLPWGHPIWFEFISHKLLRLFSPFFLVAAAVGCALSLDDPAFRALGVLQAVFYLVAAFGWIGQKWGCRMGLVGVPYMFLLLNLTTLAAWLDFVRGRFAVTWQRVH
jgi:cellulose synthase/poly-beta-1,6-N-acetylglucosamine synthase-like glycosyltransferase